MKDGSRTDEPRTPYYRSWQDEGSSGGRFDRGGDGEGGGTTGTRATNRTETRGLDAARERFGGMNWGAAFFGWLVAVGMTALLTGILSAAGAAIGFTELSGAEAEANAETISLVGGILLLAVTLVSFFSGGYVAGRMSRFDGARQGAGVWIIGLVVTIALGIVAAVLGSEYNVLDRVGLPRLPIGEETLTTGGIIAAVLILGGTLLAAMAGGRAGKRYHDKVDREGEVHA